MRARRLDEPWHFWRWNALAWGGFAIAAFLIRAPLFGDWREALSFTVLLEPSAMVLSGALFWIYRRPSLRGPFDVRTAFWIVGTSLVAGGLVTVLALVWSRWTGLSPTGWSPREEWLLRLVFSWFAFLAWSLAFFARRSTRLADRAMEQAERTELDLLRAQLDPHFLFNSLNNVAAEIPNQPAVAEEMVHELADYLRYSLDQRHRLVTPLATEIDAMVAYLKIEQARFGERMEAVIEVETEARRRGVPSFLLQPLIENAVKHGLAAEHCEVRVVAGCEGERLRIGVSNPGRLPATLEVREGVGLETLRRRLELHYPGRSGFELSQSDGVVTAELSLEGEPCFA